MKRSDLEGEIARVWGSLEITLLLVALFSILGISMVLFLCG